MDQRKAFIEKNQWGLAHSFLERADYAANIIRSLLATGATATIGFITAYAEKGASLRAHSWPLLLLGTGLALTFISWEVQKGRARKRFEALQDGKVDYEPKGIPNYILDRTAALFIAAGAVTEIAFRMNE